jgi:hypothetical protein
MSTTSPPTQLNLIYQLASGNAAGIASASVFLNNTNPPNVFQGGGYATGASMKYGYLDGNTPNQNAYFTLAINTTNPANTASVVTNMVYGDCTPGGLMGPLLTGPMCMTGHQGGGSMGGAPTSLVITQATTAVPLPAGAIALFGIALAIVGLVVNGKKTC